MQADQLVDDIYEAGVLPERWVDVLDSLAKVADCRGALLFAEIPYGSDLVCSPAIKEFIATWAASPWGQDNPRRKYLVPRRDPRFLTERDGVPDEVVRADPYYDFMRDWGLGWCVGTAIRPYSAETIVLSIERDFEKGPVPEDIVGELDRLRPHLARASVLATRLGIEKARAKVAALETIGLPAAIVSRTGRVVAANTLMQGLSPALRIGAFDQLHLAGGAAALLRAALGAEPAGMAGCSIPLRGDETRPPAIVHVVPLRGRGRDIFSGATSMLYVTALTRKKAPPGELLQALFDLTPAEAQVARAIVEGAGVDQIAQSRSVRPDTVRAELKSVFAKTGINRQADLVAILGSALLR
ncbi:MAG: helix-turn-helix transcriptional regulator [Pseudomonadota bacterium]